MRIDIDQLTKAFEKVGLEFQYLPMHERTGKPHTCGSVDLNKIVDAINAVLEPELSEGDAALVARARAEHCNDEREIDDSPMLSRGDEGAFVSAWLYMPYPKKEAND